MSNAYNIPSVTAGALIARLTELYAAAYGSGMLAMIPSAALWGPMGVGKSTAVKEIARQLSRRVGKKVTVTDIRLLNFSPVDLRGIVVNSTILEMWGLTSIHVAGEVPIHLAPDGSEGREYNAEEVYRMLLAKSAGSSGNTPASGGAVDRHDVWKGIENQERIRDIWDRRIRNAAQACQEGAGLSSSLRELMEKLNSRSKVDWRQLLHDFIQHDTCDYSFLPPDRRFFGEFFLPAFNVDEDQGSARDIWVCVDTSTSISDAQLTEALLEIRDAMRQAGLSGAVSFFDGEITDPEPFTTEEEFRKILPKGGGGTSFHVIFRYLRERRSRELPRAILIFTDGFVWQWPEEAAAMGVPVMWLICKGGNTKAPWGQVVEL